MKKFDSILNELKTNPEFEVLKANLYKHMKKFKPFADLSLDEQGVVINKIARMLK